MNINTTFTFGSSRTAVTVEKAQEGGHRLKHLLDNPNVVVSTFDLSGTQWTVEALSEILPVLQQASHRGITTLVLADTIAGLETSDGLHIMGLFAKIFDPAKKTITNLDLSDNAMGPRAFEHIGSLLSSPNLKTLRMHNCGLGSETISPLNVALKVRNTRDGLGLARLQNLVLSRNMLGIEGSRQLGSLLANCTDLKRFEFGGCRGQPSGTKAILCGLRGLVENGSQRVNYNHWARRQTSTQGNAITHLDLSECSFFGSSQDEDVDYSFLRTPDDDDVDEDDDNEANFAIHDLVVVLRYLRHLRHLNLNDSGDYSGTDRTPMVGNALIASGCPLVHLDLGNCVLGPEGAAGMEALLAAKRGTLKNLNLEGCELDDGGLRSIITALLDGMGQNTVLEELQLDMNELGEGALDRLLTAQFPFLRSLNLKDNADLESLDDGVKQALRHHFPNAVVCIDDDEDDDRVVNPNAAVDALVHRLAFARI